MPLTANPVPLAVAAEMVALAFPVLLSTSGLVAVVPTVTVPKPMLVGLAANVAVAGAVAVPLRGTASVGLEASLLMVTDPEYVLAVAGANVTCNVTLAPAAKVYGVVIPLTLKPVPLAAAAEMVALALPVLLMVRGLVEVVPAVMLPKAMLVGLAASVADAAAVAVPLSGTLRVEFEASLLMVIDPEYVLAVDGANVT